ncbi:MAG: 2-dehydropantoate 2-reductase N-terminal domain-containing protein [Anaerolineales bacterium]|jgi:2-dehydropantoate 2-reductase
MRILIYGAGPLGSIFAARLHEAGHDVAILARGMRLADIRQHGIVLEDYLTGERTATQVETVEALTPEDEYDLVMVIMRKNQAMKVLPVLAANRRIPNVLFLMNNVSGPGKLIASVGRYRVMIGFPTSAGFRDGHVIQCLAGKIDRPMVIPIGEVDGRITVRTYEVAAALASMSGYEVEIRSDMDAWLKSHVAFLMPSLALALYGAGSDNYRLARTRDALVLTVRAIREAFQVLRAMGISIVPAKLRVFEWMPEPLLVLALQRRLATKIMEVAMVAHANAARDEVKVHVDDFYRLARQTGIPTPNIDRLYPYIDPGSPRIPDGSADIPLNWHQVWIGLGIIGGLFAAVLAVVSLLSKRNR